MQLYAIIRRDRFADGPTLEAAAAPSTQIGDGEMPADIRWIRSYVLAQAGGRLGMVVALVHRRCLGSDPASPQPLEQRRRAAAANAGPRDRHDALGGRLGLA